MVERVSALDGHVTQRHIGEPGQQGVSLTLVPDLLLQQVAAWPDTLALVGNTIAQAAGVDSAPGPGKAVSGSSVSVLRVEPLKWWVIGLAAPASTADVTTNQRATDGVMLDLSHSRTWVRISGDHATDLLQRHLPLDLSASAFPVNSVASSAIHHVGVTLWHSEQGYELFLPRGFALSLWQIIIKTAEQYGADIDVDHGIDQ